MVSKIIGSTIPNDLPFFVRAVNQPSILYQNYTCDTSQRFLSDWECHHAGVGEYVLRFSKSALYRLVFHVFWSKNKIEYVHILVYIVFPQKHHARNSIRWQIHANPYMGLSQNRLPNILLFMPLNLCCPLVNKHRHHGYWILQFIVGLPIQHADFP